MLNFLNGLSKILVLIPIGMFLYDAVKSWFVDAQFKIRSLQKWWMWADEKSLASARPFLNDLLTAKNVEKILQAPGPLVMVVPPLIVYLVYRISFAAAGGKSAGGITYKSRH